MRIYHCTLHRATLLYYLFTAVFAFFHCFISSLVTFNTLSLAIFILGATIGIFSIIITITLYKSIETTYSILPIFIALQCLLYLLSMICEFAFFDHAFTMQITYVGFHILMVGVSISIQRCLRRKLICCNGGDRKCRK